jgi:hypothetical protein
MIPDRFRGVWQRVSLSVDGGPWCEPAQVIWVQTGSVFGDIRLAFEGRADEHPTMSFAGTVSWEEPRLRWHHKLDLYAGAEDDDSDDDAEVSWHGADLVCEGTFDRVDRTVPYVEVWRRLSGSSGSRLALVRADGHGVLAQVGDHAVTIVDDRPRGGTYRACYRSRSHAGWMVALSIGAGTERLPAPPDWSALSDAMVLDGRRWHVVEYTEPSAAPSAYREAAAV